MNTVFRLDDPLRTVDSTSNPPNHSLTVPWLVGARRELKGMGFEVEWLISLGETANPPPRAVILDSILIGPLRIRRAEARVNLPERRTMEGKNTTGVGHPFEVSGEDLRAELHYVRWRTGEREVRCESATVGPPAILQIGGGRRRLKIFNALKGPYSRQERRFVVLQQARIKDSLDGRSGLFGATLDALDEGAGLDVEQVLLGVGGVAFGTWGEILDEDGPTRNQFCVVFEETDMLVPTVAYLVTRVLPLVNGVLA